MQPSETVRATASAAVTVPRDLELIRLVHRGPETELWQTRQRETGALICWKGLREPWGLQSPPWQRLEQERRVLAEVNNRHVIALAESPRPADPPGLRLRWLPGESLDTRLARTPLLPLGLAVWILRQVAQGMEALLASGWLHGAIAPRHVRLSPTGEVTLLDLSASFRDELELPWLETTTAGLEPLAAQGTGRLAQRREHDLHALGGLMCRLLTGTTELDDSPDVATLTSELRRRVPEVPRELASLTARLLTAKDWPRGAGLRDVIRPLVGCELRCLLAESAGTPTDRPQRSPSAA